MDVYSSRSVAMPECVRSDLNELRQPWGEMYDAGGRFATVWALLYLVISGLHWSVDYIRHDVLGHARCSCCVPFSVESAIQFGIASIAVAAVGGALIGLWIWLNGRALARKDLQSGQCQFHSLVLSNRHLLAYADEVPVALLWPKGMSQTQVLLFEGDCDPRLRSLEPFRVSWNHLTPPPGHPYDGGFGRPGGGVGRQGDSGFAGNGLDAGGIRASWSWFRATHSTSIHGFEANGEQLRLNRVDDFFDTTAADVLGELIEYATDEHEVMSIEMPFERVVELARERPSDVECQEPGRHEVELSPRLIG